jgi:hypothetical protein
MINVENEDQEKLMFSENNKKPYKYYPNFLYKKEADFLYAKLLKDIPWRQVKTYNPGEGLVTAPKLTWVAGFHKDAYYDISLPQKISPNEIPSWLKPLKALVEAKNDAIFNTIVFTYYRDEKDYMPYRFAQKHNKSMQNLAMLTVGQPRAVYVKNKSTQQEDFKLLSHGDLFSITKDYQDLWLYSVPKQNTPSTPFVSVTFQNADTEESSKNNYKHNLLNTII